MPRLIFAAVAINLSYWICALAVDASNLLGSSVFALLKEIGVTGLSATDLDAVLTAAMSGGSIAVGGVAAVVVAMANIPGVAVGVGLMFISAALGIVLALFIGLLILSVRQALVIILLVISPLAFALYVLPGTKPIFEKWRKLFTTMLVFYPLFALFYGGGLVASSILVSASGDTEVGPQLGGSLLTMGILVQFAVLFLSPWLIFKGTGQVGELGRNLLNKGKGLTSMPGRYGRKIAGEGMGIAGNRLQNRFKRFAAGQPNNRRGRLMRGLAFGGVRRRMAKEDAEAEVKRTDSEYAHNSMPLEAMHARTMENQEITAGLEAEGKARVLTRSPTLQSAVATRKAAELGASMERANIESNAETVHAETNATLYARNKQSSLSTNLARAEAENPAETAHIQANARRYAGVKQSSLSASMERSIAENQGELQHLAAERNDLYVRQAASQGELEDSKASQDRLISDLKTEKGIEKHAANGPVDVQDANRIRDAALRKRVQSMAQQNAELQHSAESAQQILADPTIASEAGGVATHGATMAQAQAKRAVADDFNKTVAAMKTLHSQTDSSVLREKFDTIDKLETLSTEEVASDAGLIASRNHVEEQIKLQAQLQKLGQQIQLMPNSSRKTTLQDKLKTIVQQVSDDRKIKVAGLSTKELGANQVGEVAADGKNIFEASRDRILSHMTVERMATTPFGDPDQLAMYYEMARANKLSTNELNKIRETYASWKVSKQHRDSLSDNQRQLFDAILTRTPPPGYKTKYADGIATLT